MGRRSQSGQSGTTIDRKARTAGKGGRRLTAKPNGHSTQRLPRPQRRLGSGRRRAAGRSRGSLRSYHDILHKGLQTSRTTAQIEHSGLDRDVTNVGDREPARCARELRCTRSGRGGPGPSRPVVAGHLRRLTPCKPACVSKRATGLRPTRTPAAPRSRRMRGAPYVTRDAR